MLMEKTPGCKSLKNKRREYSITLENLARANGETDGEAGDTDGETGGDTTPVV